MVEFADASQLSIELVYYPPYHSKYNAVEHCWGVLERHWNGTLLVDWETVEEWTCSMRWAGIAPNVYRLEGEYEREGKLTKKEMKPYQKRLVRTNGIQRWSVKIQPYIRV
jgi:transposase